LRIAAERASERDQGARNASNESDVPDSFHISESPEEYQERQSHESALAASLGVAPWSPAFEEAIRQMRSDLLKPRMETDEEGNKVWREGYTEDEADQVVRESFRLAKAAANVRTGGQASERAG
jgi:hypothetical protein